MKKRLLAVLFLCSFVLRVLVFDYYLSQDNRYWQVDSATYHTVATSLVAGRGLVNADGSDHFYRVPGYPFFLACCYKFFGINGAGCSETSSRDQRFEKIGAPSYALWPQVFLASCIPVLVFCLALVLFPGQISVATLAACWSTLHLGLVLYAGFFMTETLFIIFFLLFLLCLLPVLLEPATKKLGWLLCLGAGTFLGIASLIRPVGQYLIIASLFLLIFSAYSWTQKLKQSVALLLGWVLCVGWWLVRNYILLGHIFFHTLPGGHFLYLSAARVAMIKNHVTYQQARQLVHEAADVRMAQEVERLGHPLSPIEACLVNERLARDYFIGNPLITVRLWATDMFRALFSLYSAELLYLENNRKEVSYFDNEHGFARMFMRYLYPATNLWWLRLLIYVEILCFLFLLIGYAGFCMTALLIYWRTRSGALLVRAFIATLFIAFFIVIALAGGYARMRLPVEPFFIILASWFWHKKNRRLIQ